MNGNARKYIEIHGNYHKLRENAWQCLLMSTFYYGYASNHIIVVLTIEYPH